MLIHTSATKTKATTTGLIKTQRGDGSQKRSSISGAMRRVRDLNTGERIIASSYLGQRKRAHTQDIQQDLVCRTGGARYQRDGARSESVAPRCAVVGSTASGRSSHPGRPPNPAEQKLPLPHLVDSLV